MIPPRCRKALPLLLAGLLSVAAMPSPALAQDEREPPEPAPQTPAETPAGAADDAEAAPTRAELLVEEPAEPGLPWPSFHLRARPLQGLPSAMAALILSGQSGGQVLFSALALPLGPAPGGDEALTLVPLLVEIDGPSLLGAEPPPEPAIEIYAYAITEAAEVRGFFSQVVRFDLEDLGEAVFAGGLKIAGHLELPAGRYELRVLVNEPTNRRFGIQALRLEVPGAAPVLSPPLAGEPPAPWLMAIESPQPGQAPVDLAARFAAAGLPFPSALPVLAAADAEVDALVYLPSPSALPDHLRLTLVDSDGEPAGEGIAPVLAAARTELPGVHRLRLRLPLDDTPTGSYLLRLTADVAGVQAAAPDLPIVVLRSTAQAQLWTDIQRSIRGEEPRTELEVSAGRPRRADRRLRQAVSQAYRTVLERLARGDREGALEDLLRIEREAIEKAAKDAFGLLGQEETAVVEELAARDAEALLPVARLHHEAYARNRERSDFGLATHSRSMAVAVAGLYAAGAGEGAGKLAARLLASIGDTLQRAQVHTIAREYLDQALTLDPGYGYALLQLATGLERTGEYAAAVTLLERLVAADPKAPEARLRLGVNLLRVGRGQEGVAVLDRLIREDNPDWVLAVAYETLAMERLRAGDWQAAVELLEKGAGRLPGQGRLLVQLSYALERAGRPGAARQALARLSPAGDEPSPRHRYSLWPSDGRDEAEEAVARAAQLRLPVLARALTATGAEGGG